MTRRSTARFPASTTEVIRFSGIFNVFVGSGNSMLFRLTGRIFLRAS